MNMQNALVGGCTYHGEQRTGRDICLSVWPISEQSIADQPALQYI